MLFVGRSEASGQNHGSSRPKANSPAPQAQCPALMVTRQCGRFVPMVLLICLATHQKRQQSFGATLPMKVVNLLLVMAIDKGLYRRNRGVNRTATHQGGQCTGQPASPTPWPQEATSLRGGQPIFHFGQMVSFGRAMCLGKSHQFKVAAPLRHRLNAFVNVDSTCLARMVRTQFLNKMAGQALRRQQRNLRHPAASWLRPAPSWTLCACLLCAISHPLRAKL